MSVFTDIAALSPFWWWKLDETSGNALNSGSDTGADGTISGSSGTDYSRRHTTPCLAPDPGFYRKTSSCTISIGKGFQNIMSAGTAKFSFLVFWSLPRDDDECPYEGVFTIFSQPSYDSGSSGYPFILYLYHALDDLSEVGGPGNYGTIKAELKPLHGLLADAPFTDCSIELPIPARDDDYLQSPVTECLTSSGSYAKRVMLYGEQEYNYSTGAAKWRLVGYTPFGKVDSGQKTQTMTGYNLPTLNSWDLVAAKLGVFQNIAFWKDSYLDITNDVDPLAEDYLYPLGTKLTEGHTWTVEKGVPNLRETEMRNDYLSYQLRRQISRHAFLTEPPVDPAIERFQYFAVVDGSADLKSDLTVPLKTFYGYKHANKSSKFNLSAPFSSALVAALNDRPNGVITIYRRHVRPAPLLTEDQVVVSCGVPEWRVSMGGSSASLILAADVNETWAGTGVHEVTPASMDEDADEATIEAPWEFGIEPGDTVTAEGADFSLEYVYIEVTPQSHIMRLKGGRA